MGSWHKAPTIAVAVIAAAMASADAHMGGMGGRSMGGAHGFHGFHRSPPGFGFHQRDFRIAFPYTRFGRARFQGWGGGAYTGDVAGFDYDDSDDFAPEDLHFRVQESFGPGDIGRPTPPPERFDEGPWDAARMAPWHGYEPDDAW